jgi:Domain of unknown function (DUF4864)
MAGSVLPVQPDSCEDAGPHDPPVGAGPGGRDHRGMKRRRFIAGILILLVGPLAVEAPRHALASVCEVPGLQMTQGGGAHPSPAYGPDEVIRLQVEALAANDDPHEDAGIEVAFRFASPANKQVTGPLARFVAMVHNALYRPLLTHRAVRYGPLRVEADLAAQTIIVTARDGEAVAYLFMLSRQRGDACDGCWMTDSVLRVEAEEARGQGARVADCEEAVYAEIRVSLRKV